VIPWLQIFLIYLLKTREKNKGYLHLRGLRKTSKDKEIKPSRSEKDLKG